MASKKDKQVIHLYEDINNELYDKYYKKQLNDLRKRVAIIMGNSKDIIEKYDALTQLGLFYFKSFNFKRCSVVLKEQLKIFELEKNSKLTGKHEIITRIYLAQVLRYTKNLDESVTVLKRAMELAQRDEPYILFMVQYNMGLCHFKNDKYSDACTIWTKCFNRVNDFGSVSLRWKIIRAIIYSKWMQGSFTEVLTFLSLLRSEISVHLCKRIMNLVFTTSNKTSSILNDTLVTDVIPEISKLDNFDAKLF